MLLLSVRGENFFMGKKGQFGYGIPTSGEPRRCGAKTNLEKSTGLYSLVLRDSHYYVSNIETPKK